MTDIFAAIDITTVAAAVIALGVGIIGITMAFKGIDLGKRAVRKVYGFTVLTGALIVLIKVFMAFIGAISALVFCLMVKL